MEVDLRRLQRPLQRAQIDNQPGDAEMATFIDVRAIAMSLPEAEEILTWGRTSFRVRRQIFVIGGDGSDSISIKATPRSRRSLSSATWPPSAVGLRGAVRVGDGEPRANRR
jgi:hypothetical protein